MGNSCCYSNLGKHKVFIMEEEKAIWVAREVLYKMQDNFDREIRDELCTGFLKLVADKLGVDYIASCITHHPMAGYTYQYVDDGAAKLVAKQHNENLKHAEKTVNSLLGIVRFRESNIRDKSRLEQMIKKEAKNIFESDKSRNGRDLETVEFFVRQGKVAELYMIENFGYEEADRRWHDLKDSDGEYTEVKAYSGVKGRGADATFVQKDLRKLRNSGWNVSKWYILFSVDDGVYEMIDKIQLR